MYGTATNYERLVTDSDAWGAKVINGQHVNHAWEYNYAGYNSSGTSFHDRSCTQCGGIGIQETCTPVLSGGMMMCSKCLNYI